MRKKRADTDLEFFFPGSNMPVRWVSFKSLFGVYPQKLGLANFVSSRLHGCCSTVRLHLITSRRQQPEKKTRAVPFLPPVVSRQKHSLQLALHMRTRFFCDIQFSLVILTTTISISCEPFNYVTITLDMLTCLKSIK